MSGLIARLIEAGTPAHLVEEVALELARARVAQEAIEARRGADRERQNRRRNVTSRDTADVTEETPAPKVSPQTPLPNPTPAQEHTPRARKGWACPQGVDPEHWRDFLANRRTKRLTDSPTAYRGQLKALDELSDDEWPPGRLVQFAAERGWGSINDPRNSPYGQQRKPNPRQAGDELLDALDRARAEEDAERETEADHTRTWRSLPPQFPRHAGHA